MLSLRDGAGHDELLLRHVEQRIAKHGDNVQHAELATVLNTCAAQARQQLLDGKPKTPAAA